MNGSSSWIEPPPAQRGLGCFAKGCLILTVFFILLALAFVAGTYFAAETNCNPADLPAALPNNCSIADFHSSVFVSPAHGFAMRSRSFASARASHWCVPHHDLCFLHACRH